MEFFATLLDRGVTAAKVRTGRDFAWDRAMVERVRELLPDDIEMFVNGKYNYTPDSARRFARVLADIGVEIFEEPIRPRPRPVRSARPRLAGCARLRRARVHRARLP